MSGAAGSSTGSGIGCDAPPRCSLPLLLRRARLGRALGGRLVGVGGRTFVRRIVSFILFFSREEDRSNWNF